MLVRTAVQFLNKVFFIPYLPKQREKYYNYIIGVDNTENTAVSGFLRLERVITSSSDVIIKFLKHQELQSKILECSFVKY